ncbi:MAG: phage antirepressor KilAC domain-containing protein [Prevotella sp.]|jgi:phage antirepressor YoqD-like protein|nr:phage antirepressor KilAC domain-containing protein [Prevotella sp.]
MNAITHQTFNYLGKEVIFNLQNGDIMVNLTEVAKAFPEKNLSKIIHSQEISDYVQRLSESKKVLSADLLIVVKGGNPQGQGTWAHQRVALRVAQKLSTDFAIWVDEKIEMLLRQGITYTLPRNYSEALRQLADKAEENERLKLEAKENEPKVLFTDAVSASETSILIGELAKILKQNGIEIGQNRLFRWLRTNGFLISRGGSNYNMPTQKSMEMDLFEIKESVITHPDGHIFVNKTPKVTGKGQIYFVNKFLAKA